MFDLENRTDQYEKGLAIAFGEDREFPKREATKCIAAISTLYDYIFEEKRRFDRDGKPQSSKRCLVMMDNLNDIGARLREYFAVSMKDPEPEKGAHSEVYLMTGRNRSRKG